MTMLIVVIAMLTMLGMVALAVDVIALYAARSEAQRAADSAALAAAKMLVDFGVTTDPTNLSPAPAKTAATSLAQDVAGRAVIAGRQIQAADVTVAFPNFGSASFVVNPQVVVTVKRPNLPTFFSRIWSRTPLSVSATATAEAFNPSNSSSIGGTGVPIVSRCVKPFLLPNCDPGATGTACGGTATTFFDATTGAITRPGQYPGGVIGETFNVSSSCAGAGPGCVPNAPTAGNYYPAVMPVAASGNACPSACGGGTVFEGDIECCNPSPLRCGTTASSTVTYQLQVDMTVLPEGNNGPAQSGVECLIHQTPGNGQDSLNGAGGIGLTPPGSALNYPLEIQVGGNHPLAGPTLTTGDYITTSDSLVTVPVYDATGGVIPNAPVNIIGFLQVFIDRAFPGGSPKKAGSFDVTIVNVSGCGSGATGTPVFPGSSSAVPVRLIR